jgi:hypothetical protein
MPNPRRGEVAVELGGKRHALCLTLGALAELEHAFGVADLAALGERFAGGRLSARDLLTLLAVGLRGGGHALTDEDRSRRCRSTAASRRSPVRSAIASPPRSGAPRQTLRSRRRRERAVALPVG